MITVTAIRMNGRKQIKSIHAENVATAAEATAIIGQMIGQDGIVDGYWDGEPEAAPALTSLQQTTADTIASSKAHPAETLYLYQFGPDNFDFRFKAIPPQSKERGVLVGIYRNGQSVAPAAA